MNDPAVIRHNQPAVNYYGDTGGLLGIGDWKTYKRLREADRNAQVQERIFQHEVRFAGRKIEAKAALTGLGMETAIEVVKHRRSLVDDDPHLDSVLREYQDEFVQSSRRVIRNTAN